MSLLLLLLLLKLPIVPLLVTPSVAVGAKGWNTPTATACVMVRLVVDTMMWLLRELDPNRVVVVVATLRRLILVNYRTTEKVDICGLCLLLREIGG